MTTIQGTQGETVAAVDPTFGAIRTTKQLAPAGTTYRASGSYTFPSSVVGGANTLIWFMRWPMEDAVALIHYAEFQYSVNATFSQISPVGEFFIGHILGIPTPDPVPNARFGYHGTEYMTRQTALPASMQFIHVAGNHAGATRKPVSAFLAFFHPAYQVHRHALDLSGDADYPLVLEYGDALGLYTGSTISDSTGRLHLGWDVMWTEVPTEAFPWP